MSIKYTNINPNLPSREVKNAAVPRKIFLRREVDYVTRVNSKPQGSFNYGRKDTIDLYDTIQTALDRGWITAGGGADGNGIYGGSDSLSATTLVTMADYSLLFSGNSTTFTVENAGAKRITGQTSDVIDAELTILPSATGEATLKTQVDVNNYWVAGPTYEGIKFSGASSGTAFTYTFPSETPISDGTDYAIVWNNGVPSFSAISGGSDGNGIYSGNGTIPDGTITTAPTEGGSWTIVGGSGIIDIGGSAGAQIILDNDDDSITINTDQLDINVVSASSTAQLQGYDIEIGDHSGTGNSTFLQINDSASSAFIQTANGFTLRGPAASYTYSFPTATPTSDGTDYVMVWNNGIPSFSAAGGGGADGNGIISALPAGNVAINAAGNQYDIDNIGRRFFEYVTAPYYTYELVTETGYLFNGNSTNNNVVVDYGFDASEDPRFQVQLTNNDDSITILQDMYADDAEGGYWEVFRSLSPKDWALFMGSGYDELATNRFTLYEGDTTGGIWANLYRYIDVTFGNTSANAISFYNDSYVFPNAVPTNNGDPQIVTWTNGTPAFANLPYQVNASSNTFTHERVQTPINGTANGNNIKATLYTGTITSGSTLIINDLPEDMALDGDGMPVYWHIKGMFYDATTDEQFPVADRDHSLCSYAIVWNIDQAASEYDNQRANDVTYALILEYVEESV